jgi:hypothetical protein
VRHKRDLRETRVESHFSRVFPSNQQRHAVLQPYPLPSALSLYPLPCHCTLCPVTVPSALSLYPLPCHCTLCPVTVPSALCPVTVPSALSLWLVCKGWTASKTSRIRLKAASECKMREGKQVID